MNNDDQRDEHRVHPIVYYPVWTPTRRKPALTSSMATDRKLLIASKGSEMAWAILELAVQADHVRRYVQAWPTTSAPEMVEECKGLTWHELGKNYPILKRLSSLWTRSYFAATAGNVSAEAIQRYMAAKKGWSCS
jgi:putative transposase